MAVKKRGKSKASVKKTPSRKKQEEDIVEELSENNPKTLAVIYLLLNLFILPGLGSLLSKKTIEGIFQIIIFTVGAILFYYNIGVLVILIAWIWALITSIKILKEANKKRRR